MENNAYLKYPTVCNEQICFATDDDLWKLSKECKTAVRLTSGKGIANDPHFSPSGKRIAYTSSVSGQRDLYIISESGGMPERMTYHGDVLISGWISEEKIIFQSSHGTFNMRERVLFEINTKTKVIKPLNLGHASALKMGPGKSRLLGRNLGNPARWKRYRGGTAGTLWVDKTGKNNFKQILTHLKTNLCNPEWVGKRIFFISDHQGVGNIYSCDENGKNVKRHTDQEEYYVRSFSVDGEEIIYQCGAELWRKDLGKGNGEKLSINVPSSFDQSIPRAISPVEDLHDYVLAQDAEELTCVVRGQIFSMPPWSGAPMRLGDEGVRYKKPSYIYDEKEDELHLLAVGMEPEGEEEVFLFDMDTLEKKKLGGKTDWGKIYQTVASPDGQKIAIANNRCELFIMTKAGTVTKIDTNKKFFFSGLNWSPDGRYLAYECKIGFEKTGIKVYDTKSKKSQMLITPVSYDGSPHFDPTGEYLYFVANREFHPVYNETHFDLGFPFSSRIYAVVLKKDGISPLELHLDFESEDSGADDEEDEKTEEKGKKKKTKAELEKEKKKKEEEEKLKVEIDFDGIDNRIVPLPIPLGGYRHVMVVKDKIYWLKEPVKGINPHGDSWGGDTGHELGGYDFKVRKPFHIDNGVWTMRTSRCKKYMMYDEGDDLRIIKTDQRPTEEDGYNRKDGFIDLKRIRTRVDPKNEWLQMYKEAWILQREHFWTKNMSKINWQQVYKRYLPLLDKVHTRFELSDLMWEMQGELGTSHAYEGMGDYHREVYPTRNGYLGGKFKWIDKEKAYEVLEVHTGDSWIPGADSPLNAPSVGLKKKDLIYGVDGQKFTNANSIDEALIGKAGAKVNLTIARKKSKSGYEDQEFVVVKTLVDEHMMLYRQWVDKNKEYVHKKSGGKLGYIHVPNMGPWGFSEFYRNFLTEVNHEGLVIDIRYNGGGHVSQHLLKVLAQKKVGFDTTRYFGVEPYPMYAPGALVCLTNEHAGSDGDIFPHSFKLMKLGKLVGKRTWGGVIGIWPRVGLNDGAYTTQPEFSFWFKDVGFGVENFGTKPDIEIDNTPKDFFEGRDAQLDKAIQVGLGEIKKNPDLKPNFKTYPDLKLPKLPKS